MAKHHFRTPPKRASFSGRPARSGGGRRGGKGRKKQYIHHSKFIKAAQQVEREAYVPTHTFDDFKIVSVLKQNLAARGFTAPSPIQDQSIPLALTGVDVIGLANTGTGKTVAFAVPALDKIMRNKGSRALIMAPTRELAQQILEEINTLTKGVAYMRSALLIGGANMRPQLRDLKRTPQLVIGTPGRIKDHIARGSLKPSMYDIVVLDEVDRMLDMGFVGDMREILGQMPEERQSYFFSATMEAKVRELIDEFGNDPQTVSVKTAPTSDNVDQNVIFHGGHTDKLEKLHNVLNDSHKGKFIIFEETKRAADRLSRVLNDRGFRSDAIHGDKSQGQRQRALKKFKDSHANILVATDVAARGIDVPDVTHVINYTTPQSYEDYVHRIGRAGRAGKAGTALTFVEEEDRDRPAPQERTQGESRSRSRGARDDRGRDFSRREDNRGGRRRRSRGRSAQGDRRQSGGVDRTERAAQGSRPERSERRGRRRSGHRG